METFSTVAADFFKKLFFFLLFVFCIAYLYYKVQLMLRKGKKPGWVEQIGDPADIRRILSAVIEQKAHLKVRLNARKRSFLSTLLGVTPPNLLIDGLFPKEGNDLIRDSNFLRIDFTIREKEGDQSHIPYTFDAYYFSQEDVENYPALRISFPKFIKRDQKRNYFRIDPPVNEPIYIQFPLDDIPSKAKIANISGGGIGFYTNQTKAILWRGRRLKSVTIKLPGLGTVECDAVVHVLRQNDNPVLIDGKPFYYCCGVEFADMERTDRETVVKYVIEKEREELRRLRREFS